jgi:hypothetical protein
MSPDHLVGAGTGPRVGVGPLIGQGRRRRPTGLTAP